MNDSDDYREPWQKFDIGDPRRDPDFWSRRMDGVSAQLLDAILTELQRIRKAVEGGSPK